jgi:hypothetical protein
MYGPNVPSPFSNATPITVWLKERPPCPGSEGCVTLMTVKDCNFKKSLQLEPFESAYTRSW